MQRFTHPRTAHPGTAHPGTAQRPASKRQGMSLLMTMVTISTSLVLTMTFMRTQTVQLQISENVKDQDYALEAAQSGAKVALQKMSDPDWEGVASSLTGVFHQDSSGVAKYVVTFSRLDAKSEPDSTVAFTSGDKAESKSELEFHPSLYVKVTSQGIWTSGDADTAVTRTVEVGAYLRPRFETRKSGRKVVSDALPNPHGYDIVQQYTLFAHDTSTSLTFDPGDRIEGNVYVGQDIRMFHDPPWSDSVRATLLESAGKQYVNDHGQHRFPHPLSGSVTSRYGVRSKTVEDLKRLQVPMHKVDWKPTYPTDFKFEDFKTYQIYKGGPEYRPVKIDSYLRGKYLHPTENNPLGIFYASSSLVIYDDVTVVGTLLVDGEVKIYGKEVYLSSYNWRGDHGELLTPDEAEWPRLPAIIADKLFIEREVRVVIEGAINLEQDFLGAGCTLEYADAKAIDWETKATVTPHRQPYSYVQLYDSSIDLSLLRNTGHYEVYLEQPNSTGVSGGWHRIVSVDARSKRMLIVGEVNAPDGTIARIRPSRTRYVEFRGPLAGEEHNVHRLPDWDLSYNLWTNLRYYWIKYNEYYRKYHLPEKSFVDFIAQPQFYSSLGGRVAKYGLSLEPTFHLRRPHDVHFRWAPPLIGPAPAETTNRMLFATTTTTKLDEDSGGYRWGVIYWREVSAE